MYHQHLSSDLHDFVLVLSKQKPKLCFDRSKYHCKTEKRFCFGFAQNQNKTQNRAGQPVILLIDVNFILSHLHNTIVTRADT